jgi:hypothetical protein
VPHATELRRDNPPPTFRLAKKPEQDKKAFGLKDRGTEWRCAFSIL